MCFLEVCHSRTIIRVAFTECYAAAKMCFLQSGPMVIDAQALHLDALYMTLDLSSELVLQRQKYSPSLEVEKQPAKLR